MKGYLTDKLDYYSGNYSTYFLKALVAREGGTSSHINLLTYLLNSSFTSSKGNYSDLRPLSSLLHLLTPKACIFLSFYLQIEEELTKESIKDKYQVSVISPYDLLVLNSSVSGSSVGNRISSLLKGPASPSMGKELSNLLSISYKAPDSPYLGTRLEEIYKLLLLGSDEVAILNDLLCTRDKSKSLSYIATSWGYAANTIYELKGILYDWN